MGVVKAITHAGMKPVHLALLLVAAAIGMQAATDEAYLDSMIDDLSHDVGASDGRRGGPGSLTTSGSFMMAANRAGNDEEEFGEADEDPPAPQADSAASSDYNLSVGEALDAGVGVGADGKAKAAGADADSKTVLSTPALLASCKKSWPFQIKATPQTIHVCVKCKPDAPLPAVIAKHGKHLIWACDATKFKDKELCKKSLSWLGKQASETGQSAKGTCGTLGGLIWKNNKAAKLYVKHSQDLKLSDTTKLTSVSLYDKYEDSYTTKPKSTKMTISGKTRMQVEKTISVALKGKNAQVFTVLSHTVRACGYISEQPLQCLDMKQSQCIWSIVKSEEANDSRE